MALSLYLYGNPFLRESFDLDFLVHPDDVGSFDAVLKEAGCLPLEDGLPLTPRQTAILARYRHHDRYRHRESGINIESHWGLYHNRHLIRTDFDALWERRTEIASSEGAVPILVRDDLMLQLGNHATRYRWERWKWIADMVALHRPMTDADFSRLWAKAASEGCLHLADATLLITRTVTNMELPLSVLTATEADRTARRLARRALAFSVRNRVPGRRAGFWHNIGTILYGFSLKRVADQRLDLRDQRLEGVAVIGIARHRLGMDGKLTALGVPDRGGHTRLDAELVRAMRLANALHFRRVQAVDLAATLMLLLMQHRTGSRQHRGEGFPGFSHRVTFVAAEIVHDHEVTWFERGHENLLVNSL